MPRTNILALLQDDITIQQGDEVRVRLIGYRVETRHMFAVGSIADDYLGFIETANLQPE
jgi:DNA-directed RNA polymerase subunit E'/Rpb7